MKFMFIDETGRKESGFHYFLCLCGVIVDKSNIISLNNAISDFKEFYGIESLKDLRTVDQEIKMQSSIELFELLRENEVDIISAIIGNVTLKNISTTYIGNKNIESQSRCEVLPFLVERFYFHLRRRNKDGLMIFDSLDKGIENKLKNYCYNLINRHFKYTIYPSILFSKDEHSEILQATDLIGLSLNNAIYRSIDQENEDMPLGNLDIEDLPNKNPYLKIYWPLFESNPANGRVEGWGVKVWI